MPTATQPDLSDLSQKETALWHMRNFGEIDRDLADEEYSIKRLSARILELREMRGWSQRELGERAGMSGSAISNYENEIYFPQLPTLARIADAFDAKPSDLLDDAGL